MGEKWDAIIVLLEICFVWTHEEMYFALFDSILWKRYAPFYVPGRRKFRIIGNGTDIWAHCEIFTNRLEEEKIGAHDLVKQFNADTLKALEYIMLSIFHSKERDWAGYIKIECSPKASEYE